MMNTHADTIGKSLIGIFGTAFSATGALFAGALDVIAILVSIVAGITTSLFMWQQYKNAKAKGQAFKEDRENEN